MESIGDKVKFMVRNGVDNFNVLDAHSDWTPEGYENDDNMFWTQLYFGMYTDYGDILITIRSTVENGVKVGRMHLLEAKGMDRTQEVWQAVKDLVASKELVLNDCDVLE